MTDEFQHKYIIVTVKMIDLHNAPWEPAARLEISSAFNSLKRSIQQFGLLYPPLVTMRQPNGSGYIICDGHRRTNACRALNWTEMPVRIMPGEAEKLFAEASGHVQKTTAVQWIEIYLGGGAVASGPTRTNIKKLEQTVGKEFLVELINAKMSPQIWQVANAMHKYCDIPEERKSDTLHWILRHKLTRIVMQWIHGQNPVEELRNAFLENRAPGFGFNLAAE